MKFLVDAHLPKRLANFLREQGFDAIHTLELPDGNRTTDAQINAVSLAEHRVVITKDADFIATFIISKQPHKLLLITTGNISNDDLQRLFTQNIATIALTLQSSDVVELTRTALIRR